MKSKVFGVVVECWEGSSPTAVFYRHGPGQPYTDWMQPHKIRTRNSAARLTRVMEGGELRIVSPDKDEYGRHLPGMVSIFKKSDPAFWAAHDEALRTLEMDNGQEAGMNEDDVKESRPDELPDDAAESPPDRVVITARGDEMIEIVYDEEGRILRKVTRWRRPPADPRTAGPVPNVEQKPL